MFDSVGITGSTVSNSAFTHNRVPRTLVPQPELPQKAGARLLAERLASPLTQWIRLTQYSIPVRTPQAGELVRIDPTDMPRRNWFPVVIDDHTGEIFRVSHEIILRTRGKFVSCYKMMMFVPFMSEQGELALWPTFNTESDPIFNSVPDAWVRVVMRGPGLIQFEELSDPKRPEPVWPELTWIDIANMGLHDRVIESENNSLIRQAHGRFHEA